MKSSQSDTIFALASGAGRSGVAVFRISGPQAQAALIQITRQSCPQPRYAALRTFYNQDHISIDSGLVLWMPGPSSFTGEDCAEFHTHGSLAVLELIAQACLAYGIRHAEPGEFTRRAFENGRMDLTEAEGLADLIDAQTQGQHAQALRQMQGGLREIYENWRDNLLDALAAIEGEIDFPDEVDVPDILSHQAYQPIIDTLEEMQAQLKQSESAASIRTGLSITLIGPPNAGKSTLLNQLSGKEAAIVSPTPGTTRDIIEAHCVMAGLPVSLIDTAGIRTADNEIEAEGIHRAKMRAKDSDIRIAIIEAQNPRITYIQDWAISLKEGDFLLLNKIDLDSTSAVNISRPDLAALGPDISHDIHIFPISAQTGDGIDTFKTALGLTIRERFPISETAGLTRARHKDCVERAALALKRALDNLLHAPELSGDDLRSALHALKELAGEVNIEAVFDRIFSRFCIGK